VINGTTRTWGRRKWASTGLMVACISVAVFLASPARAQQAEQAAPCGAAVVYDGKGAGQVLFDGKLHTAKGLTCADCHESKLFSLALFTMQRGGNDITMRKMELGRSCGYCHQVSMKDTLNCNTCHRK
jgi:c(7)-type cytochrome triheme protein